ncbi:MAG: hypothetical protein WC227_03585 [Patescibacteria group bacterium]
MWIIIGTAINWLGFLVCVFFGVALPILKIWGRQMDLGPGYFHKRREYKTDIRSAIAGGAAATAGYCINNILMQYCLFCGADASIVALILLMWSILGWRTIRAVTQSAPRQPDKDLDGVMLWYFIRGKKSRIVHRDEVWILRWWNIGGFVPAVLTRRISTFDRESRRVSLKVRYYGTDGVLASTFRDSTDKDLENILEYCHERTRHGYTDEDPPVYAVYLNEDFPNKIYRIMCMGREDPDSMQFDDGK